MQGNLPVQVKELVKLTSFDADKRAFKFGVTCIQSDKYISISDTGPGQEATGIDKYITIIELDNNFKVQKKPNKADAQALMHWKENIIAMKAKTESGVGSIIQVFNLGKKEKLKNLEFNEQVVFWAWVSLDKLAIVTTTSVYHADITKKDEPQIKIMDRTGTLANPGTQIIGYSIDATGKWSSLFGISSNDGGKTILGHIQLYLIEGARSQILQGHCCCFGEVPIHDKNTKSQVFCFVEKKEGEVNSKVHITEISAPPEGKTKHKKQCDISYSPEYNNDFPVFMHCSQSLGLLYIMSKFGFLFIYEMSSGQNLLRMRISNEAIFAGARNSNDGVYVINKAGGLVSVTVDPNLLVAFIMNQCSHVPDNTALAFQMAAKYNLPGADQMFLEQFNTLLIQQDFAGAAKLASEAPGTLLRNSDTINRFKSLQAPSGPQPILIYFQTLLQKGKLNQQESIELIRPVLLQNKIQFIENWLRQDQITCSEELGDLVKEYNKELSITIYERANCIPKLVQVLLQLGRIDDAQKYQMKSGIQMDYMSMFREMIPRDPEGALTAVKSLYQKDPNINVYGIAEIFLQNNRIKEMSAFLVECMQSNKPEDGPWQTKVLELNLHANALKVVEAILNMERWNQFNKQQIAMMLEQKGMLQRALEFYQDLKDIRRVILNTHMINPDWMASFMGRMQPEWILICLNDMLRHNRQNIQLAVKVCQVQAARLNIADTIKMFESVGSYDGLFFFLGSILANTKDKDIHFKYIEAAAKCGQIQEVSRVIREKQDCYDPAKVKDFLKEIKLNDPKPLIAVCDTHGYIEELSSYLYKNGLQRFIEVYLFRINPNATPQVLGTLIDLECEESYIKQLLYNIRGQCPIEELVESFEKRNRLKVLENWLESRVTEGNQLPALHNALAKIKIDTNQDPNGFLLNNQFYDSKVVGKYCEERDPHLAYQAYKRAWGNCDMELIEVTNKNCLYRLQASYLVERQSLELWAHVLTPDNPHRKSIIEHVIQAALPNSKNPEEVSTTVQAFMAAEIQTELLQLLEKIVLHNSEFGQYNKLQNLLIITAIKADKTRVMDYIKRLDNYDGPKIAQIALGEPYQLYEEAFTIYQKQNYHVEAVEVLLNNIDSLPRATSFADQVGQPEVYTKLGHAYLDKYLASEAIDCYLKAKDATSYQQVIQQCENEQKYEKLVQFLLMARELFKDQVIDNSLIFCYAKLEKLPQLEEFVSNPNSADITKVGDKCYEEKLYEAAKILFISVKNNGRIASCLVRLKQFQKAIEAAKKANTPRTWKELCVACVEAEEFKLATIAGMEIIIHPDHLEDLAKIYEKHGAALEMISLLQTGMGLERAHIGIFTELGILYAKHQQDKLMEHCKQYFQKLNVSKLLRICERYQLWSESVYLYSHYDEYDNAVNIMIEHSPIAWQHDLFCSLIQKVSNSEFCYKGLLFYYEQQPQQINDYLKQITTKIDLTKAVQVMKKTTDIALITPFLKSVQSYNNQQVNEALNQIFLEQEDYDSLRKSITNYENFEVIPLAKATEKHELLEFRRIASYLYRKIQKYDLSIQLSKQDKMFRDCIETAQESGKYQLVEDLMFFFVKNHEKEMFTCLLYTCYEFVRPDIALELAWRFNLLDFAMPYFIQIMKEITYRLDMVVKKQEEVDKKQSKENKPQFLDVVGVGYDPSVMMLTQGPMMPPPPQDMFGMPMNMSVPQQNMMPPQQQGMWGDVSQSTMPPPGAQSFYQNSSQF